MVKTDEKLMENFLAGDEKSLELLIDRYLKPLYGFVLQLVGDGNVAQDIVQEVFVKAWKHANSFNMDKKFSTWLYAIAKNTAYDFLKKKKTIPFSAFENSNGQNMLEFIEDQTALHSSTLLQKMDDTKEAQEYLQSLKPELRTILVLHHKQGFSLVEIAEIMKSPANTVKSKYRRAIFFLKKIKLSTSSSVASKNVAPETNPAS